MLTDGKQIVDEFDNSGGGSLAARHLVSFEQTPSYVRLTRRMHHLRPAGLLVADIAAGLQ